MSGILGNLFKSLSSPVPTARPMQKAMTAASAERQPKAMLFDPLSLSYSMGYKDRKTSLSYDVIRKTASRLSVVSAIINTRVNQVATFCVPFRQTGNLGFEIKHKDRDKRVNASDRRRILELESFISNCGKPQSNYYNPRKRDNFSTFTKKVIRDRMRYDALTFEIVPDRKGDPFEIVAVDASTIRIAVDSTAKEKKLKPEEFENIRPFVTEIPQSHFDAPRYNDGRGKDAAYVQVWHGSIKRAFSYKELAFGIQNPRTDMYSNGYGLSELEELVDTVTCLLWAEQYNKNFFKQGSAPKGILNIRGDNIPPEQLEAFKRNWIANIAGVENTWKTPVLQSDEIQYLNLQGTNMEMEYSAWMEYLIKLVCAVYLIAPEEIGFFFAGGGMQQPMVESNNEWKLKASKDRGLRPLLRYYADVINENVVNRLDPRYYLDFVGLDELTERERIELRQQEVLHFRTVNEIRKDEDQDPLEHGDVILNPAYLQWIQMQHQWDMEKDQLKHQRKMEKEQLDLQKQQSESQQQQSQQQMAMQQKQMAMQEQAQKEQSEAQAQMQSQMAGQMGGEGQEAPPEGVGEEAQPQEAQQAAGEEAQPQQSDEVSEEEIKQFLETLPADTLETLL